MNKQRDDRLFLECERWRVFAVLMVAAGFLGAFTYCLSGGVFCNAQTGNFLLMAIELADGNLRRAAYYLIPIAAYFFGAVVSEFSTKSLDEYDIFTDPRIRRIPEIEN